MAISAQQRGQVNALLDKGDLKGASELLAAAHSDAEAAKAAASVPAKPRTFETIALDLFHRVHGLLGSNPALDELLAELEVHLALKEPAPPEPASPA
jgi:hypothetical protein